jgi:hypothetical protein
MKVFISHKRDDEDAARRVRSLLEQNHIPSFLDCVDANITPASTPQYVTDHILGHLADCTHIIPVVSGVTPGSWWVPFEIGVAMDMGKAVATYMIAEVQVPEFLMIWPVLRTVTDILTYARVAQSMQSEFAESRQKTLLREAKQNVARSFEWHVKRALGQ